MQQNQVGGRGEVRGKSKEGNEKGSPNMLGILFLFLEKKSTFSGEGDTGIWLMRHKINVKEPKKK